MCTPTFLETSFTILGNSHVVPVVDRPLGLLLNALARGPELRIYSHKVHMYISGMSRSGMSQEMLLHTIGIGRMCITQSDIQIRSTQIWRQQRSFAMEMEVGDDGAAGPPWLGYFKHQTASPRPIANITRATCASPAPAYDIHA